MGGVAAKHDGVVFQHRSEYMRWTLGDVRAAVERWHALSKRHGSSVSGCGVFQKFGVNKREFWEIFTDYSMLRDGAFLCLPVRHASTPRACALHARCHGLERVGCRWCHPAANETHTPRPWPATRVVALGSASRRTWTGTLLPPAAHLTRF